MKRRRKASTYIMVIFMASVIMITGTAVLSVISQDIKSRINESRQIQNLYGSDSNLDLVYSIIVKDSDMAVSYAKNRTYQKYKDNEDLNYSELNQNFKKDFLSFLGTLSGENASQNDLYKNIESKKYLLYKQNSADTEEQEIIKRADKGNYIVADVSLENSNPDSQDNDIKVVKYDVDEKNMRIIIQIESTFETKAGGSHKLANKKTIITKYTIKAPDYSDDIERKDKNVNVNLYQVQKGLYVNQNLNIDNSKLLVNGTTWVKGKNSSLSDDSYFAYDKYNDGITINKGSLSTFGNLSTNKSISLRNLSSVSNNAGNVYAQNIYFGAGKNITSSEKDYYSDNKLNIDNDLVTNNDLTIDAKKSTINIKNNYYGISDKTEKRNGSKLSAAANSSSIIINTNDQSEVNINNNAYVSGLAYIDFNKDKSYYKTGESVAVIGNYKAYAEKVMSEIGKDESISFSEHERENGYDPLELIEFSNEENDADLKADHFIEYYNDSDNTIKDGGIKIGNKMFSIGASNYKTSDGKSIISKSSLEEKKEMGNEVKSKRADYGVNVFNLGYECDGNDIYNKVQGDSKIRDGISDYVKTLDSQIDFDKLPKNNGFLNINSDNSINQKYGYSILDGDNKKKDSNALIIDNGVLKQLKSGALETLDLKSYDPDYKGKVKAVIITKGDLIIRGKTEIYGCVIVGGNLYIENGADVSVNYDENVIENIMAHNNSLYEGIFKSDAYKTVSDKEIKIGEMDNIKYSDNGWYDADTYLKQGLWKLVTPEGNAKRFDSKNEEINKDDN